MTYDLACLLADGSFHSGRELGDKLSISKSAVWKQVQSLISRGVQVDAIQGRGYRILGGLDLLSVNEIQGLLPVAANKSYTLDVFDLVESTNSIALERVRVGPTMRYACLAEQQSAGRGRRGKVWISPFAQNIYASLGWSFDGGLPAIQGLSVAVGIATCEAIESLGCSSAMVKWPNDIFHGGEKLGGVLVEAVGELSGRCAVVVGVGVNVTMRSLDAANVDQPWTSLERMGYRGSRNLVAARILTCLARRLERFETEGLGSIQHEWGRLDALAGEAVCISLGEKKVEGMACGIDSSGALLVKTEAGMQAFFGGEVSVRRLQ